MGDDILLETQETQTQITKENLHPQHPQKTNHTGGEPTGRTSPDPKADIP
jgi:hypothetical protein